MIRRGITVKVNSLLMPGINDHELNGLSKRLKAVGVSLHNIMPLIAKPDHGTLFGAQQRPTPSHEQLEAVRVLCGSSIKQMAHCRLCRADAEGKLGEMQHCAGVLKKSAPLPNGDNGLANRKEWRRTVKAITAHQTAELRRETVGRTNGMTGPKIAVCHRGRSCSA